MSTWLPSEICPRSPPSSPIPRAEPSPMRATPPSAGLNRRPSPMVEQVFPMHLPLPPWSSSEPPVVDEESVLALNDLEDVPPAFVRNALRQLGSPLLASSLSSLPACRLPSFKGFNADGDPITSPSSAPHTTHILHLHFHDAPNSLLLPVHGLLWALTSPLLLSLASPSTDQTPLELHLPSLEGFALLLAWLYHPTPAALLEGLHRDDLPSAKGAGDSALALGKMQRIRGLWRTVVALKIVDEELWEVMRCCWAELSVQAMR